MLELRKAAERGHAVHGWLDSWHSFSFADYYDPRHMGVSTLRVINEDRIKPGAGFPTHPHQDMEIVTYVLEGALEHRDSTGNHAVIRPGEVQRMTAGTGITHSEFNHSAEEQVHLLQIWILPNQRGLTPGYEQRPFAAAERRGRLRLLASPDGTDGSVTIHQDTRLYGTLLADGEQTEHRLDPDRIAYLHVAQGSARVNNQELNAGDAVTVKDESHIELQGTAQAELLLFDMPNR
ncbi:MAG: pirin family protein [Gammaproteobacteria bacterium]|jgi:quercetin 2,3-dioxygenase